MRKIIVLFAVLLSSSVCMAQKWKVVDVERSRILIDCTYDAPLDAETQAIFEPKRRYVDSVMSPVVGKATCTMDTDRPEGTLSNLFPDVLVYASRWYNENVDFGVFNIGGIRASLLAGDITVGDVYKMSPFDNKICFVTLSGDKVLELFQQILGRGGEGVSHSVRIVGDKQLKLVSASINGKEIDKKKNYRVATIDYVAQGNNDMRAFLSGTDMNSPSGDNDNMRFVLVRYFKDLMSRGESVCSEIEGRIKIEK